MYFDHLTTVGAVKSEYRRLAKIHHPDLGGSTATMQDVNAAYHTRLQQLDGTVHTGTDGKEHRYYYNEPVEQDIMDKITELLALRLPGILIELIGTWIWVSGDTKPVRAALKSAGCIWHRQREMWYYRRYRGRRFYSGASLDALRQSYGSRTFEADDTARTVA